MLWGGQKERARRGSALTDYLPQRHKQGGIQDGTNLNDKAADFS